MEENGEETHAVQAEENVSELKDTNGAEKASEVENSPEGGGAATEKKARGRGRAKASKPGAEEQANEKKEPVARKRAKEPSTPIVERPARERKSIDRFAASVEKEKVKEFKIEKGAGVCLKDIPNVVFKLSKRKGSDDAVQLLHKIMYGKRIKPHHAKPNILQFSGYVWSTNQEKDKAKYKEKLEKCVKESLVQISDILDLNFPKAASKKEEVVTKLFEFLESPHKTTEKLLEEMDQKSKVKKRKKTPIKGAKKKALEQTPRKKQKREGKPSKADKIPVVEEPEEEEAQEEEDVEEEPEEEPVEKKRAAKDSDDDYDAKLKNTKKRKRKSSKKQVEQEEEEEEDAEIKETKSKPLTKSPKKKPAAKPIKSPVQSPSKDSKKVDTDSSKVFLRKKKKEEEQPEEESPKKEKGKGGNQANAKEESKPKLKVKVSYPSDEELRAAICELLQDVDFSTVTFTDVVKQLGKKFSVDLSQNKAHVKELIQEEISKIVDEDDGEGEDDNGVDENAEKDKEDSDAGDVNDQVTED